MKMVYAAKWLRTTGLETIDS